MTSPELREVIRQILLTADWTDAEEQYWTATDKIMHAVKDHVVYVIGEDEKPHRAATGGLSGKGQVQNVQNRLRAEQRNRAGGY